jgi:hypothetical protein
MSLTDLTTVAAEAALSIAQDFGEQIEIHFPGEADWLDVWALFDESLRSIGGRNGDQMDEEEGTIVVPKQTGFPPSGGLVSGCAVRINGNTWEVVECVPDVADERSAATFALRIGRNLDGTAELGSLPE